MKLHKKTILFGSIVLVITAIVAGSVWLYGDIMKTWHDEKTWKIDSAVSLPVVAEGTFKMTSENIDTNKTKITVPFCVLFNSVDFENGAIEYHCAAIPYTTLQLIDYFPTRFQLKKDIVFTYVPSRDVLPSAFLGRLNITNENINSIGAQFVPASLEAVVSYAKPEMNPTSLYIHYQIVKKGEKESYAETKLESWSMSKVRLAAEYSAVEKKEIIKEWRKNAWKDVNELLRTSDYINATDNKELVSKLGPAMAWRSVYCPTALVNGKCEIGYPQNAATNIMYYTYAATVIDQKAANRVTSALNDKVIPFVYNYNTELAKYYGTCDPEGECAYFHSMNVYDYPVCPINDLTNKGNKSLRDLYMDLRFISVDDDYIDTKLNYDQVHAELEKYRQDFLKSGIRRTFGGYATGEVVSKIDKLCLHLVYNDEEPDKRIVQDLKSIYSLFVLGQVFTDEKDYANKIIDDEDVLFQMVLNSSILNPYDHSFVHQPYTSYHRIITGVYKADNNTLLDGYWGSINTTLILLYLTSSYQ